jgi:hypothetical protein
MTGGPVARSIENPPKGSIWLLPASHKAAAGAAAGCLNWKSCLYPRHRDQTGEYFGNTAGCQGQRARSPAVSVTEIRWIVMLYRGAIGSADSSGPDPG